MPGTRQVRFTNFFRDIQIWTSTAAVITLANQMHLFCEANQSDSYKSSERQRSGTCVSKTVTCLSKMRIFIPLFLTSEHSAFRMSTIIMYYYNKPAQIYGENLMLFSTAELHCRGLGFELGCTTSHLALIIYIHIDTTYSHYTMYFHIEQVLI